MVIVDAVSSMWQMVPMGGLPNPHPEAHLFWVLRLRFFLIL